MLLEGEIIWWLGGVILCLTRWVILIMVGATPTPKNKFTLRIVLYRILVALLLCFLVQDLFSYYYWFEVSLLPIFFLVLGWGYQPERLVSALYILFYTLAASLPLLTLIVLLIKDLGSSSYALTAVGGIGGVFWCLAFLVKLPVFLFHLWLPKAHVEAPVSGSIILAGLLLKLGGFGLLLVRGFIVGDLFLVGIVCGVAIIGGFISAIIIMRLSDVKVIIAYSSVVHIGIVAVVMLGVRRLGLSGGLLIILAHGLTSSGIFRGANIIYERSHSRRLVNNKGGLSSDGSMRIAWFLLAVLNFAGPFTINLGREMIIIRRLVSLSLWLRVPISGICFLAAAYNLNLYALTQQGGVVEGGKWVWGPLTSREIRVLWSHIIPGLLILGVLRL